MRGASTRTTICVKHFRKKNFAARSNENNFETRAEARVRDLTLKPSERASEHQAESSSL